MKDISLTFHYYYFLNILNTSKSTKNGVKASATMQKSLGTKQKLVLLAEVKISQHHKSQNPQSQDQGQG